MLNNFSGTNKSSAQNTFNAALKKSSESTSSGTGTGTGAFMAKLGAGLGVGGYGVKKINDLNDHPNNISDFGHVGKVFGIGENDASVGTSVGSSSEAIAPTVSSFPPLKDKGPLDKMDFKERLKNLKLRRGLK